MNSEVRKSGLRSVPWRLIGWGGAVCLLLLPLVTGAPWTLFDYVAAAGMFGILGGAIELILRASTNLSYRAGAGLAVMACILLFWVNGAVGFLGDEDNPANLMFLGVIAVAVVGSVFSGFRAAGMARTMFAAAGLQVLIAAIGYFGGFASPGFAGIYEVVMGTTLFGSIWLVSGGLFRNAAREAAANAAA